MDSNRELLWSCPSSSLLPSSLSFCSMRCGYNRDEAEWLQEHKCIRTRSQLELFFRALLWIAVERSGKSEYEPLIQFIAFCMSCVKLALPIQLSGWDFFFFTPSVPFPSDGLPSRGSAVYQRGHRMGWCMMHRGAAKQQMLCCTLYYTAALQRGV